MKSLAYIAIALVLMLTLSCYSKCDSKQNGTKEKDTVAVDMGQDSSRVTTEFGTISDLNMWLRIPQSQLKTEQLQRLADAYNSAVVMNSIMTDFDLQMRLEFEHDDVVKAIKGINVTVVKDKEASSRLQAYKSEMLYLLSVKPNAVDQNVHNPWKAKDDLDVYLSKKYNIKTFGKFNEKKIAKHFYNCPSVPEWEKLMEQRGKKNMVNELKAKYGKAKDFNAQCIYAIELAHAYETDREEWYDKGINPATSIMESLMQARKYSPYLFKLWQTWRVLYQNCKGYSKDSAIPNDIYNKYRNICASTILSYIEKHPNDLMAVNEFLLISYEKNVLREGDFSYGNQNAVDEYYLFPEKYAKEGSAKK